MTGVQTCALPISIGVSEIILSGGEPLTRTDIFDIVELLKTNNFNLDICTNAYCLNQNIAKKLSEYFREISVSLDSFQESVHNSLRLKKDAYQRKRNCSSFGMWIRCSCHYVD